MDYVMLFYQGFPPLLPLAIELHIVDIINLNYYFQ